MIARSLPNWLSTVIVYLTLTASLCVAALMLPFPIEAHVPGTLVSSVPHGKLASVLPVWQQVLICIAIALLTLPFAWSSHQFYRLAAAEESVLIDLPMLISLAFDKTVPVELRRSAGISLLGWLYLLLVVMAIVLTVPALGPIIAPSR
jgi:hypothetical protein